MIKTLLITDIVNSTALTHEIGNERMSKIWIEHDHIARDLLKEYKAVEADRTDGFLMLFDSVNEACQYAIKLHNGFETLSENESIDFKARIGIHSGEIILIETSEEHKADGAKNIEVEGIAKPTAARVMSTAIGGQILLSKEAFDDLDKRSFKSTSHGHWRMKGVAEPLELFEVGDHDIHFHPPADSEKVYRVNLVGEVWEPVKETKNNLTKERDRFVGRTEDLHKIAELVNSPSTQLLTILGPGGTGKTRISKRFGRMWLGDYPGGVWFCDLAECHTLEGIALAVGASLGMQTKGDAMQQIANAIQGRGDCMIILDNFEQITKYAEETLGLWMDQAPKAKFIVTSRNLLNLPGERTIELQPLPVNEDAVNLFEARANERKSNFHVSEENREDVFSIVKTLDGMPLAIELAAARIAVLSPKQIRERLKERFKLLTGKQGVSKRQQTLRAAIDWSWDILEDYERSAFAQCSVFEGGFTLEAAEEVVDLSHYPDAPMTMDVIHALVNKSLLRSDFQKYDAEILWFGQYVSLHEYSKEKLITVDTFPEAGPELEKATRSRHAAYFSQFGTDEHTDQLTTHGGVERFKALDAEIDNLWIALNWAIQEKDQHIAVLLVMAIFNIVSRLGSKHLLKDVLLDVLNMDSGNEKVTLKLYAVLIAFAATTMDSEIFEKYIQESIDLAKKLDDKRELGYLIARYAYYNLQLGKVDIAEQLCAEALENASEINNQRLIIISHYVTGFTYTKQFKIKEAMEASYQALEIAKKIGEVELQAGITDSIGSMYQVEGNFESAILKRLEAFSKAEEVENKYFQAIIMGNLASSYAEICQLDNAKECGYRAMKLARENGDPMMEAGLWGVIAQALSLVNKLEEAITYFNKSIIALEKYQAYDQLSNNLCHYGFCLIKIESYDEAEKTFLKVIEGLKEIIHPWHIGHATSGMGTLYSKLGRHDESLSYFEKAEQYYQGINVMRLYLYKNWVEAAIVADNHKLAKEKYDQITEWLQELELSPNSACAMEIERVGALLSETR